MPRPADLAGPTLRGVYTVAPGEPFVDSLAAGLLAARGADPLSLAAVRVLLPTRRAARALREAFLRLSEGAPLLLPRMDPLGDVDEDEFAFAPGLELGAAESAGDAGGEIPAAIAGAAREAQLARLVDAWLARTAPEDARATPAQALRLARGLAGLLDELQIEGVTFGALHGLVDDAHAVHWQRTLAFLRIVGDEWPNRLAELGLVDPVERRNRLIRRLAERWQAAPPAHPVIAAGSTGSQPATRALLAAVAGLPNGAIVLPGLDTKLDEESWRTLEPGHPQFGLRELLAALGVARGDVRRWPDGRGAPAPEAEARAALLSEAMRPAETTAAWADTGRRPSPATVERALEQVTRIDAATPQEEAAAIALALREALEVPGRTAALATPDRGLARRVAAELARWNIEIDDSAGRPLADTAPGSLLRLATRAVAAGFAPVALLALLKHPLVAPGIARGATLAAARTLDRKLLRGPAPAPGLATLREAARAAASEAGRDGADRPRDRTPSLDADQAASVMQLLDRVELATAPLTVLADGPHGADVWLRATAEAGERLAADPDRSDGSALWRGDAGEALAGTLAALLEAAGDLPPCATGDWPALLDELLAGSAVRPRHSRHPRLAIWGPLEARLQRADRVVLGGLNEGGWPADADTGPWLSRPMREALGLPQPERRIGLAAHDFVQAFGAPEVFLSRSERVDGAPTVPSRWLARLDALVAHTAPADGGPLAYAARGRAWLDWAAALDRPERVAPCARPAPRPPAEFRPVRLSVSAVERLRRDPYGFHARHILRLSPLDGLEDEPGHAERGSLVHALFDAFLRAHPDALPPDTAARLLAEAGRRFAGLLDRPAERAFWWPRVERMVGWFVVQERERRAAGWRTLATEARGVWRIEAGGRPLELYCFADRIDRAPDGGWELIDYKTGRRPSDDEIAAVFAPQLPLEAAIARHGGFDDAARARAPREADRHAMAYWLLHGSGDGGEIATLDAKTKRGSGEEVLPPPDELILRTEHVVRKLLDHFSLASTPYRALPWPRFAPKHNDYAHLARQGEWVDDDEPAENVP